MKTQRKR
jgi:putative transposase